MIRKDRNFCDFVFYFNDTLDRGFPTIPDFLFFFKIWKVIVNRKISTMSKRSYFNITSVSREVLVLVKLYGITNGGLCP